TTLPAVYPLPLHAALPISFGGIFDVRLPAEPTQRDGVAIVEVRGPLMHHRAWFFDSYEAIVERVESALAAKPRAVVLSKNHARRSEEHTSELQSRENLVCR